MVKIKDGFRHFKVPRVKKLEDEISRFRKEKPSSPPQAKPVEKGSGWGIPLETKEFKMKILTPILSHFWDRKINGY